MLLYCKSCEEEVEPFTSEQVFGNGKMHIRADCSLCKGFLKYLPQYIPDDIDYKNTEMPFGKFKGQKIVNIDQDYLYWLLENNKVSGKIKLSIERLFTPKK